MSGAETPSAVASRHNVDLVFEGGGMKGIGLVGALSVLEERGYQPQYLAGSSAGSIVAALYAAGYRAPELRDIMLDLNFRDFMDTAWEDSVPFLGRSLSILKDQGIYEGDAFLQIMSAYLEKKGIHTFADLLHPDHADYPDEPRYQYKVQLTASDITSHQFLILPRDAHKLGVDPKELNVALAVRMSMSIPIFFEPVRFRNPETEVEHLIVDGGMLSNFPVWLFDSKGEPEWPTFGLLLVEPEPRVPLSKRLPRATPTTGVRVTVEFLKSLVQTMMEAHDRLYLEKAVFVRTIPIPTLGVRTTEFDLSRNRALDLYQAGRTAAEEFLTTWDFPGYIEGFRTGKVHSRREEIASQIADGSGVMTSR
jgi:NTE family protein